MRLRVCAVATKAAGNSKRNDEEHGVHFVHRDCGGWITKPTSEPSGQPSCFVALGREATCTMLPQVVLAFIAMHSAAILDTDDLSELLGMGGESVLTKCRDETRAIGTLVRAANRLGLSEVTIIAHRLHCRAECLARAEAQQADWARTRRMERLAAQAKEQAQVQDQGQDLSFTEEDLAFLLVPADSHTENPMAATVRWFRRTLTEPATGMIGDGSAVSHSQSPGGSATSGEATACIALFSGSLQLSSREQDGPEDLLHIDESKCLAACLGGRHHHTKCPNYERARQRELQLAHWRKTSRSAAPGISSSPSPRRPPGVSRHALRVVAAVPPSAASELHGGEGQYKGKAVVILRGGVDFMTKQRHAAAAGAAAVIFVNLEEDAPFLAFPPLDEIARDGAAERFPNIPAVCLGRSDGEALLAAVRAPISPLESEAAENTSTSSITSLSSPAGSVRGHREAGTDGVWVEIRRRASQKAVERWQKDTIQQARLQRKS